MKTAKKVTVIGVILTFVIIISCIAIFNISNTQNIDRLSDAKLSELRDNYPIYGVKVPAYLSMQDIQFKQVEETADTFAYCEVIGTPSSYSVSLSTGDALLDEKRRSYGIADVFEKITFDISIIEDANGLFRAGEKLTVVYSKEFEEYYPKVKNGQKFLMPIKLTKEKGKCNICVQGTYYVTDDGYIISAYDESRAGVKSSYDGMKVAGFLKAMKQ